MGEQTSILDIESNSVEGFDDRMMEERAARRTRLLLYCFSFLTTSGLLLLLGWMVVSEFSRHSL
jgi:hypothetical protein